ncbi:MAG: hypothetical protein AAF039_06060 [Bacteroidota bacterium]
MVIRYTNLLFIVMLAAMTVNAQKSIFRTGEYKVYSEDNEEVIVMDTIFKGKKALMLDGTHRSMAVLEGINTENFRIEMDIAGMVMSGLGFHAKDGLNYQFIYFRPGLGNTKEAIQYIPIYNGALSWVFYNYPMYETTADIESMEWFHAAFEVRGNNLKVFVHGASDPEMDIPILVNPMSGGKLLLRSLFGPSYFANIMYRPLAASEMLKNTQPKTGFLTQWEISKQFSRDTTEHHFESILERAQALNDWKPINVPEDAYVNFARYFEYPNGVVVAKTKIESNNATIQHLHFDFVGRIKIMLNGNTLYTNKNIKFERVFDGTYTVGLPLKKGNNELVVIAEGDADFFGKGFRYLGRNQHSNWGFIARVER